MELTDNTLIMTTLFCIAVLIVSFLYLDNVKFKNALGEEDLEKSIKPQVKSNSPLANIFYLYNHNSEKDWLKWISNQDKETRMQACNMIVTHLEDSPKHWGYATLEALESLKGFKDLYVDHHVGKFFNNTSHLWGEYKSVPNYYQKSLEVLCFLNEQSAINLISEEFNKGSNSQNSMEKKKIIINVLPDLGDLSVPIMTEIITDLKEAPQTRIHAFHNIARFPAESAKKVFLETTKVLVSKYKSNSREIKSDDLQLIQDLLKESIKYVSEVEFFEVIDKACRSPILQEYVIEQIVNRIESMDTEINAFEIYALIQLEDNAQSEIKRVLAKKQNLEINEINNIIVQRTKKQVKYQTLAEVKIENETLPIPDVFKTHIKDIHKLLTKTANDQTQKCEKQSGGILITGDANLEKLYLLKALAKSESWDFTFINCENVNDKVSCNEALAQITALKKPYLIYLYSPHLLLHDDNTPYTLQKQRFMQIMSQGLSDIKSFIVGDIPSKKTDYDNELKQNHNKLKNKFFAHEMEMSNLDEKAKLNIIENFLKYISIHRFGNRKEVCNELLEIGKEMNIIEFTFFVLDTFKAMLLVFGKDVPYSEIKRLETRYQSVELEDEIKENKETLDNLQNSRA